MEIQQEDYKPRYFIVVCKVCENDIVEVYSNIQSEVIFECKYCGEKEFIE